MDSTIIIEEYVNNGMSTKKIANKYHIGPKKVKKILLENNIDIHNPNRNFGPRNKKPTGYWEIKEHCEIVAKECKNCNEFSKKYSAAYKSCIKNGWILEFSNKFYNNRPEFPSLNSPIHCVYAYEIKETNSVYVGRTNGLKRRDHDHRFRNDNDSLRMHCINNGVEIPKPIILEENLTGKESQIKEKMWLDYYVDNGWNKINIGKTGENSSSLGSIASIWTYDTCKEAAKKCTSKEDFKKKYSRAHNVSITNKWLNEFFPTNMKRENGCFDTLEGCMNVAKDYSSIMQIRKEYPFLYHKISKNKWTDIVKKYITNNNSNINHYYQNDIISFNKLQSIKLKILNNIEYQFYSYINKCSKNSIIDNGTIPGELLIIRCDEEKILFTLINVSKNSSFSSNNKFKNINKICNKNNYRCIQIYDTEYINKKFIIENKINHYLKVKYDELNKKIYGRKVVIKEINKNEAEAFLNTNHIQGFVQCAIYLGAYYKGELVSVMSFKKGGLVLKTWELARFASSYKYIFSGVGGKMFKYFVSNYKPEKVISFADKRWGITEDNIYNKIGFTNSGETNISYFYFNKNEKTLILYHKFGFRKNDLLKKYPNILNENMTETEMVKNLGYDRIWDCGLIRYIWENTYE